jgi:hypothetical protein
MDRGGGGYSHLGRQSPSGGKIGGKMNTLNEKKKLIFYAQQSLNY